MVRHKCGVRVPDGTASLTHSGTLREGVPPGGVHAVRGGFQAAIGFKGFRQRPIFKPLPTPLKTLETARSPIFKPFSTPSETTKVSKGSKCSVICFLPTRIFVRERSQRERTVQSFCLSVHVGTAFCPISGPRARCCGVYCGGVHATPSSFCLFLHVVVSLMAK